MDTHWAALPALRDTESGIAAIEREQMTKPRPLDVEGPVLHHPSAIHQPATNECCSKPEFPVDEVTVQSVKLLQYYHKLRALVDNTKQQLEGSQGTEVNSDMPAALQFPVHPVSTSRCKTLKPLPFVHREPESLFCRGFGTLPKEVEPDVCRRLLRQAVAAVCAQAGYTSCTESCLDTLLDACDQYILQVVQLLRTAVDDSARSDTGTCSEFHNVVMQVFNEIGIGNPVTLHDFYQTRVVGFHSHLAHLCQQLQQEYSQLTGSELHTSSSRQTTPSVKEGCTSHITFPTTEETEDGNYADHVLHIEGPVLDIHMTPESETGFTLEEETNGSGVVTRYAAGGNVQHEHNMSCDSRVSSRPADGMEPDGSHVEKWS